MKAKRLSSLFGAVAIFGTATMAMAGAYGEAEQAEEIPRSAPVQEEMAPVSDFAPFPYLAVGGVYGEEFFSGDAHLVNAAYGWGANVRAGYRFHEMWAAEMLYEHLYEVDSDGGDALSTDRRVWSLMPNVKFFPIQGFAEPYISVGGGLYRGDHGHNVEVISASPVILDTNDEATENLRPSGSGVDQGYGYGMRFGGGIDLYATEQLFFEAELAYMMPMTEGINNYEYLSISLGIGYAFN